MFRDFFLQSDLLIWPIVAFAIFFVAFMAVLVQAGIGLVRRKPLDDLANLPLERDSGLTSAAQPERRV